MRLQVPGGYQDSLSKNTKLGRAVDDACSELSHLGELVSIHLLHNRLRLGAAKQTYNVLLAINS